MPSPTLYPYYIPTRSGVRKGEEGVAAVRQLFVLDIYSRQGSLFTGIFPDFLDFPDFPRRKEAEMRRVQRDILRVLFRQFPINPFLNLIETSALTFWGGRSLCPEKG